MSWTAFLLTYLLGGITFVPLIVATVLFHAYLTFPVRQDDTKPPDPRSTEDDIVQAGDDITALKAAQKDETKPRVPNHVDSDVAAGYFAVCREYTPMGINAKPIERSTPVGSTTVAAPSPSVYQTMYRSLFDRKQNHGPLDNQNTIQRPKKAGNVFYVVLRHGHLMLFDDDEQLEVRHVVSLAHHCVSIYSGGDKTPEGELFIKRNAICLSRRTDGADMAADTQVSKPFYLFSENCSAKEDFYFALLKNQPQPPSPGNTSPSPLAFDIKHIISLVQRLHSSEEHIHSRWLNAMIGRMFLGVYRTKDIENFIRQKLTKKISRVKRPSFLSNITIQGIDTGESAPYITNPRLKDLTVEGECCMEADVKYTGNFRLEVAATARIELGSRLKAREVSLVLAVVLRKLEGHVLLKIKPPPSNRVWFSFQSMPKMEMTIEPIVSSRQITYTVILRQIENRIKEVIAETLVLPFWDDIPFFKTEHKNWRGGIFQGDDAVEPSLDLETSLAQVGDVDDVDQLEESGAADSIVPTMEKSHSLPIIEATTKTTGFFGRKKAESKGTGTSVSSASTSTTSTDTKTDNGSDRRTVSRGTFLNSPTPTISTDSLDVEAVKPASLQSEQSTAAAVLANLSAKSDETSHASAPAATLYRPYITSQSPSQSSISSRETIDTENVENNKDITPQARRNTASSAGSQDDLASQSPSSTPKGSVRSHTGSLARGLFSRKENTAGDSPVPPPSPGVSEREQQRRNALAAVTNAAASAKRWGLNALQRHNESGKNGNTLDEPPLDLKQPMGRGRPLPPPGTPLPMPDRKTKTAPPPAPRRKPVPAPVLEQHTSSNQDEGDHSEHRRPVPPPPLPRRRKVAAKDQQPNDDDTGMLVVEAPTESEPTTPLSPTHSSSYVQPWAEDVGDADLCGQSNGSGDVPRRKGLDLVSPTRTRSHELGSESASTSEMPLSEETYGQEAADNGGDEDDFSAWMDDAGAPEHDSNVATR
ncbi:hypothetical protein CONLIGDRAFT_679434 [Coniochaeta ligniaria NRRL 30616]|uniref:SMP-LTD domain-containing protein n=1 Tax=Coniochaeta ligniaria NRRL 30616 TaxID=1408157 RepID=A0A1J7JBJ9_9PEZI|nr:hypothetical protein CONLIGDRAFT_679434 [Coniochaeta ligniaria NRRL 30616]